MQQNVGGFDIFKGLYCFYQEHLEGGQKEQINNSNEKELVLNNKMIIY